MRNYSVSKDGIEKSITLADEIVGDTKEAPIQLQIPGLNGVN